MPSLSHEVAISILGSAVNTHRVCEDTLISLFSVEAVMLAQATVSMSRSGVPRGNEKHRLQVAFPMQPSRIRVETGTVVRCRHCNQILAIGMVDVGVRALLRRQHPVPRTLYRTVL